MNKTAIKNYAIWARVQLIEAAKQRAYEYEITENGENKSGLDMVDGRLLTKTEKEQRNQLISEINRKGFSQVMEEAAYTWFNRFIALRFMEVNGYLPSKVRVFTDENGAFKPEILKQAMSVDLEGLDRSKVLDLLDKQNNEELFKYLLITQCNALNAGLPYMFEKIANWTELLFPTNLLRQDSVIGQMISEIPEEDWTDAVQIIGWLYQYYNSELKDETFALLKKNVKISKERIPAATQLFTPDWIVRYMVENSLGRLWYEGHPDFDKTQWKYYLDEAEQEPEVESQLQKIRSEYAMIKPEEIKVIDPCMGSGHILVYAFDILMQIYTSAGWSERDAAKSILENNLYGLDIDDRAGQLAYFAVMMKARKHSRRILNGEVKPNVLSIQDSNWMTDEFIAYVAGKDMTMKADLVMLRKTFKDAKEYGSVLNVPALQYDALYERIDIIRRSYAEDLFQAQYRTLTIEYLLPLVKQSQIMSQKYTVAVTNPPYMGGGGMNTKLALYLREYYPETKADLFSAFIEKCGGFVVKHGYLAMITMESWMFLSSFENMRKVFLTEKQISSMTHMPYLGKGGTSLGISFGTVAFSARNTHVKGYQARFTYVRYYETDDDGVPFEFPVKNERLSIANQDKFSVIPSSPVSYWVGDSVYNVYLTSQRMSDIGEARQGLATGDNGRFMRSWYEVQLHKTQFHAKSTSETVDGIYKWFPYNKGGEFRKWYGNQDFVVNWENDGYEIRHFTNENGKLNSRPQNMNYYFKKCCTWSLTNSSAFGARFRDAGSIFDINGMSFFTKDQYLFYSLAYLCSNVCSYLMRINNPTFASQAGDIAKLPIIVKETVLKRVSETVQGNIEIAKTDWDSFETSWDFKKHPLI